MSNKYISIVNKNHNTVINKYLQYYAIDYQYNKKII